MSENKKIIWEKVMQDYNITYDELLNQVFQISTNALSQQLEERHIEDISVSMGKYELILKKASEKRLVYEH